MAEEVLDLLVEGGKAAPGPTTAPKLGAYKLNVADVFKSINEATAAYKGMQVPVKLIIDKATKKFRVEVGTPPVSSLIKKELGIDKAKTKAAEEAEKAAEAAEVARAAGAAGGAAGGAEGAGAAAVAGAAGAAKTEVKPKSEDAGTEEAKEGEEAGEESKAVKGESEKKATGQVAEEVKNIHRSEVLGNLKMEQVVKIAKMKMNDLLAKDLKSAVKMVIGTAASMMGVQVEGVWPKDAVKDVDSGKWDDAIK